MHYPILKYFSNINFIWAHLWWVCDLWLDKMIRGGGSRGAPMTNVYDFFLISFGTLSVTVRIGSELVGKLSQGVRKNIHFL